MDSSLGPMIHNTQSIPILCSSLIQSPALHDRVLGRLIECPGGKQDAYDALSVNNLLLIGLHTFSNAKRKQGDYLIPLLASKPNFWPVDYTPGY